MLIRAYERLGFIQCHDSRPERGVKKIAIYVKNGVPLHVAVQRPDRPHGRWFSKLGQRHDIEHDLQDLEDGAYGFVHDVFLRKGRTAPRRKPNDVTDNSHGNMRGRKARRLKIEGDWEEAVGKALNKKPAKPAPKPAKKK